MHQIIPKGFYGAAIGLAPSDVADAAQAVRVPEAHYRALLITETGGRAAFQGLPPRRRSPILMEAHWNYRLCGKLVPGLSVPEWDRSLYGRTLAVEYDRLDRAMHHPAIGEEIALKSTSWGLPQILGVNHGVCGLPTVWHFIERMLHSAADQLDLLNAFLTARKIVEPLLAGDWDTVARLYNGTQYRKNAYHLKLADAARRAARGAGDGVLWLGDAGPDVSEVQRALVQAGITVLVDGDFGRRTALAVEAVQASHGLPVTGQVDAVTAARLGIVPAMA